MDLIELPLKFEFKIIIIISFGMVVFDKTGYFKEESRHRELI